MALIEVLALRKVKVNSPLKTKDMSIFSTNYHSSPSPEPRAASGGCPALCHPLTVSPMRLSAPLTSLRCEAQPICKRSVALTQSSCLEICSGQCSVGVRGIWRILLCYSPAFFSNLLKVPLMSVSGEPPACELGRLFCSTQTSACRAPASA